MAAERGKLIEVSEAERRLARVSVPLAVERVPLAQALYRTAAETVVAESPLPPFDRAAMDGYAFASQDTQDAPSWFDVAGMTQAGAVPGPLTPGTARRIFTGAPLPAGSDAVLEQEAVVADGDTRVYLSRPVTAGRNVMARGHEVPVGRAVLTQGSRIGSHGVGLLAATGRTDVAVFRPLTVAVVEVGSELGEPGRPLMPAHIYPVHRVFIPSLVAEWGGVTVCTVTVPDDREAIRKAIVRATEAAQVVFTTGGTSVGLFDYLPDVLGELGELLFWRVAMHPGKAVAAARRNGRLIVSLSGNPGAAYTSFMALVAKWWAGQHHGRFRERWVNGLLSEEYPKPTRESRYLRVRFNGSGWTWQGLPQGADVLTAYSEADGFAVIPAGTSRVGRENPIRVWLPTGMGGRVPWWEGWDGWDGREEWHSVE